VSTTIEEAMLTEQEFEDYISVAFANGFSKGTANVSPADMKRLRPILEKYKKSPHPFRACVKDNKKRFGPNVNKYCAVIKDLIEGSTKWRGKKKGLSESTLAELFGLEVDYPDILFFSEISEEEMEQILAEETEDYDFEFAAGDVAWDPKDSLTSTRQKIEAALNGGSTSLDSPDLGFWVSDISKDKALVCEGGQSYFVVPYKIVKGEVELEDESNWTPVAQAWVEENVKFSDSDFMAEVFLASEKAVVSKPDKDGFIWKTILREGQWKISPSGGKAQAKPITIVKDGVTDRSKLTISMSELKRNFEAGAVEHVTIPTSHEDKVTDNTGFIRKLRFGKDEKGRAILEAAMDFTEPDVKGKAERGTIANTSAGILFDYVSKEAGKKYRAVLKHAALTNSPWLNGMKPFGVNASEDTQVYAFSEEITDDPMDRGGDKMSVVEFDLSELGVSSAEELKAELERGRKADAKNRQREIDDRCTAWQTDGKAPALVLVAKGLMMADKGSAVLSLSEDGNETSLTATDIVTRLVDAVPSVKLADDQVGDQQLSEDEPDDKGDDQKEAELSQDEKRIYTHLYFNEGYSSQAALAEAKKRASKSSE
jgi:hypothetical protein